MSCKSYKISALLSLALLLCVMLEYVFAQPFTWSKGGSRPQDYDMGGDPTVSHGSANGGFIKSKVATINGFGTYLTSIAPGQYRNQAIKLSAYVKTVNVASFAGLWMRVDAGNQTLSFDNMGTRPLVGTMDWEQYEIILDVPENSTAIFFGLTIDGTGEAYVDGLQIEPAARTWNVISTGTTQTILALKAVDENTVWAGATGGTYLRTTDGGATWKTGGVPGATALHFNAIAVIDQDTAYYTGQNWNTLQDARIYKTTDGGATWTQQYRNTGVGAFFNSIAFWNANNGVATSDPVGGSFLIVTTTDGGATWNQVPAANLPAPKPNEYAGFGDAGGTTLFVEGKNKAWFGTGNGAPIRVIKSTDQGKTWTSVSTPLPTTGNFFGISTVTFADSLTGFAGGYKSSYSKTETMLVKTTDGGQSWNLVPAFNLHPSTIQYIPNTNNKMMVASSGQGAAYSNDGGDTWQILPSTQPTYALSFVSPTVGWASSLYLNGKVLKFIGNFRTAVTEQPTALPSGFHLAQNYPNPFNPSTLIQYEIPQAAQVQLAIYNLLGERVRTLVDANEPAGIKQVTWDGRDDLGERVSSSVYLYRLAAGEVKMTKRLLLMK
ncbi:T9SS type A sorting domain-containing protein [candidate division KSB1 bacterium]|nr:T9SS type A sorting domain-containing protein [candidate division KSB1 bacterium]